MAETANHFADFADFANHWPRITVFYIDAGAGFDAVSSVVAVIRNITGAIFDEIVFSREAGVLDDSSRGVEKIGAFIGRHIQINGLEQAAIDEAAAEIA